MDTAQRVLAKGGGNPQRRNPPATPAPKGSRTLALLRQFYEALGSKERRWFMLELPRYVDHWYGGQFNGKRRSQYLTMGASEELARTYERTDALAVALQHLKPIYPVKIPPALYRLSHLKRSTQDRAGTMKLTVKDHLKALQSWTSLKRPQVNYREEFLKGLNDFILEWKPIPKMVVASTDTILRLIRDMKDLAAELETAGDKMMTDELVVMRLETLADTMAYYLNEKEFLVYVERPITVKYRLV